jgi:NAD(P)-dependent dehydrogenase (short-subunit alcohol dehydrogenase family)
VVNFSSIGGLVGLPGYSTYNATKFAVEGLSEALAAEVGPLGICVTVVEPGPFRTDFLGSSLVLARKTIEDYAETSGRTRAAASVRHGNQPGDPVRGARAIIDAVTSDAPPLHLPLGRFAYERGLTKFEAMRSEFEAWKEAAIGADFTAEELAASGADQTPLRG